MAASTSEPPPSRFRRSRLVRIALATVPLVLVLGSVLAVDVVPKGLGLALDDIPQTNIRAPRAITFTSASATSAARDAARSAVPPIYDYTSERAAAIASAQAAKLELRLAPIDAAFDPAVEATARTELLRSAGVGLTAASRETLAALDAARWMKVHLEAARVLDAVERPELRDADVETIRGGLTARMAATIEQSEGTLAAELLGPFVISNSTYSSALTAEARDAAAQSVLPVKVSVQQNEVIVDAGHPVTVAELEKIDALGMNVSTLDAAKLAGWFLAALLVTCLLFGWLGRFRPEYWHRTSRLALLGLLLVLTAVALRFAVGRSALPFFLPFAAVPLLAAILLDATTGVVMAALIGILAGVTNGGSLELATYALAGGIAGVVAVRRGDRAERFVEAAIGIGIANAATMTTFSLLGTRDLTGILQLLGASAISGVASAIAAVGSFAVLGNVFGVLTVFRLLELANPSQALLRRLLVEAPGTYHHSLMVGNLAERAAEAIGADPLLVRVAAYYHDIGKLNDPLAFIENQAGVENIHDELAPETSAELLKSHVAAGIDIAYAAKLPTAIIAFIPQHHGTAPMSYFYAKAREEAAAPHGGLGTEAGAKAADAVDQRRYRHAGPKPQSREAAVLMLADGVEASVRSLSARDEAAIRAMVGRIIAERLEDGQFDECDLTLRDLDTIREAFVGQLLGMYHQRVAYPQNKIVELESRRRLDAG